MKFLYKVTLANSKVLTVYPYISVDYIELALEGTHAKIEEDKLTENESEEDYDLTGDFDGCLRQQLRIEALEAYIEVLTHKKFNNKL